MALEELEGAKVVEWNRRCEVCHHWQRFDEALERGSCYWSLPPLLSELVDMLKAEPATHIDYKAALADAPPPTTHANYGCGAWAPRSTEPKE